MKGRNIIYKNSSLVGYEILTIEGCKLRFVKKEFQTVREIVTPINELKKEIQFDKSYHFILILIATICFILSCLLLYKFYATGDWRKYLGISVFILSILGLLYYVVIERNYGIVIINCRDESVEIRTQFNQYEKIRESIINKLITISGQ